jgi:hypothetical protein
VNLINYHNWSKMIRAVTFYCVHVTDWLKNSPIPSLTGRDNLKDLSVDEGMVLK